MSAAPFVPEAPATDDGPWTALARHGRARLLLDAGLRLRRADGTSHARSLAFLLAVIAVQGLISVVGVVNTIASTGAADLARELISAAAPGPVGGALHAAMDEARHAATSGRVTAIAVGVVGAVFTATILMGQLHRAFNRIYGIDTDLPFKAKYWLALRLALSAGVLFTVAFAALVLGDVVGRAVGDQPVATVWGVARYPIGTAGVVLGVALLLRYCPRRQGPGFAWNTLGALIAVVTWTVTALLLNAMYAVAPTFGDLYGPLATMIALLLWALLSSLGLLYGAAVTAELEAERTAGQRSDATG